MMLISKEKAEKVYDLLISIGGAHKDDKGCFIHAHTETKLGCGEWRFCGKLGFGGKYRSGTNTVDCYPEDENEERLNIIKTLNEALKEI